MPLDTYDLVVMAECLNDPHLVKIDCVTNVDVTVVAGRCHVVSIGVVADTTDLLTVQHRASEALSHPEVPDAD